jgi:hypothetical protein
MAEVAKMAKVLLILSRREGVKVDNSYYTLLR